MEQEGIDKKKEPHLAYLDSARGIAALLVFTMHFIERKYQGQPIFYKWACLFNGNEAVSFFFVLSGFVLSYKYVVLGMPLDIKKYFVARMFRIWPAFFLIVLLSCLYSFYIQNNYGPNIPHKLYEIFVLNKYGFWEEALLMRGYNGYYFPGWTLTAEMASSFLLPFFICIVFVNRKLIVYFILTLMFVYGNFKAFNHFLLGMLVATYFSQINKETFSRQKWYKYRYIILLLALFLWDWRYYVLLHSLPNWYIKLTDYVNFFIRDTTAVSSAIFLVAIIYSQKAQEILGHKIPVFIGKLSYSIYLIHPFAIDITYRYIEHLIPSTHVKVIVVGMVLSYIVLAFLFALIIHYCIELPGIKMGKKIINRMKPSLIIAGAAFRK